MKYFTIVLMLLLSSCASLSEKELQERDYKTCVFASVPLLIEMGIEPEEDSLMQYCTHVIRARDMEEPKEESRPERFELREAGPII